MATRAEIQARLTAIDQKKANALKALQVKRLKLKAQLAQLDRPSKAQRRLDVRRKILIGAFVLDQLERVGQSPAALLFEGQRFADWLIRLNDRALFEMPGLSAPTPAPQASPTASQAPTFLNVPFEDKDRAKALGAYWDAGKKRWFVPAGSDLAPFSAWLGSAREK